MQKLLWVMPLLALLAALTQSDAARGAGAESELPTTPAIQAYLRQAQQRAASNQLSSRPLELPGCEKPTF